MTSSGSATRGWLEEAPWLRLTQRARTGLPQGVYSSHRRLFCTQPDCQLASNPLTVFVFTPRTRGDPQQRYTGKLPLDPVWRSPANSPDSCLHDRLSSPPQLKDSCNSTLLLSRCLSPHCFLTYSSTASNSQTKKSKATARKSKYAPIYKEQLPLSL